MSLDISEYNKIITATKYFSLDGAIKSPIKSRTAFIIANERIKKDGDIGRYFTVFPTFQEFLNTRNKYIHCHELLVDHIKSKTNQAGRLVFDFDIKDVTVPKKFKNQIEDVIIDVLERFFNGLDIEKLEFIWSTSQNPQKFSKHLTVKHLYFDNWIKMSKIFYQLFCVIWDEKYFWILSNKLIDFQIVRNNGSLRMVGSTKINGYILHFDNNEHTLTDSLIRIYFRDQRDTEQLITKDNINENVFSDILFENNIVENNFGSNINITFDPRKIVEPVYINEIYKKAYEMYSIIDPGIFKMGKISGNRISFIRTKPHKCLLSGKKHDQENAFCSISVDKEFYSVYFGCYRYCYDKKKILIGSISTKNLIIFIHPDFEPTPQIHKKENY